ncbi:threonine--tRNA ligase [Actinomycetes bacterium KLBMP 9797]
MIDHRKLGRELDLFHTDPLAGAGLPIWLPAGAAARHAIEEYIREEERRAGYQHVYSPPLGKRQLFELSGHLAHFDDDMFPPMRLSDDDEFLLRPSMCPFHALVFRARGRSYRDLPLRIAELGGMYRAERSGVLGGLSRVRNIWLNDAHTFCAVEQAAGEVADVLRMIQRAHAALGVRPAGFRLSLRGDGGKYVDDPPMWDRASGILREALDDVGLDYVDALGEAAFYGPKIDVQVVDAGGREMTLSTVQLDFHQAARFELSYVDADNARRRPVIVHRSIVGSMERLFAHLIEVHEGAFPMWYAPVQVAVLPVGVAVEGFVKAALAAGLRVEVAAEGTLANRVREAAHRRIPYAAVLGAREPGRVSLRPRNGAPLDSMPIPAAVEFLREAAAVPFS